MMGEVENRFIPESKTQHSNTGIIAVWVGGRKTGGENE
jgi:hypothetical protein